jgi:hypothetical protein
MLPDCSAGYAASGSLTKRNHAQVRGDIFFKEPPEISKYAAAMRFCHRRSSELT